ncbi:MAG: Fis family transcriptional regulator, partial [Chloroflexi bacterium]|nr:Fis family transcriptional regulator [Chloroflexota bacterium]
MTNTSSWSGAFPIRPASDALEALCESWQILTERYRPGFHYKIREPKLTRALKTHVERITGPQRGLLGMWAAEAVHNEMDMETGELTDERRTDIIYGWNNQHVAIHFVLEFKKISRTARSLNNYLGP